MNPQNGLASQAGEHGQKNGSVDIQSRQAIEPRIRARNEMKGRAPYLADPSFSFPLERAQGFVTVTCQPFGAIHG
jgi:hypothetical protein